jgi:roadblock/LC7 domain-containing protein
MLTEKYDIDPEKTVSVLYRGTDKCTEVRLASPEAYLDVVKQILDQTPANRVLVQTDQTQVLDYFKSELGNMVVSFSETPSTSGNNSMIDTMEKDKRDMTDWMQWFDAALRCVAECAYVVNHTGNCGLWMNLYRGNVNNVFQFNEAGQLT